MSNLLENTKIFKCVHSGWTAKTMVEHLGHVYQINTSKGSSNQITSSYCKVNQSGGTVSFWLTDLTVFLRDSGRATEKSIKESHSKALTLFEKVKDEIQSNQKQTPEIGSIIFLDGYNQSKGSDGNQHIVYDIETTGFGIKYLTVEASTFKLQAYDHVRAFSEKFGIGMYFDPSEKYTGTAEELNQLVLMGISKKGIEEEKEENEHRKLAKERSEKIVLGKTLITIPEGTKSLIVADMYQNDSDSMTDYFSTSVSTRFYLGFSKTTRNNMSELEKSCLNWEKTRNLLDDSETVRYTDGHSQLPNYFIGSESWTGLKVHKAYINVTNDKWMEEVYIAAADNRCFFESKTSSIQESKSISLHGIEKVDYSEKAFALVGNTVEFKNKLKELGGRFNYLLTCGPGWIFSKSLSDKVEGFFASL